MTNPFGNTTGPSTAANFAIINTNPGEVTRQLAAQQATITGLQQSLAHERSARKKANARADAAEADARAARLSADRWERRALSIYRGVHSVLATNTWTKG